MLGLKTGTENMSQKVELCGPDEFQVLEVIMR